ncbi:MAG TPA: PfkB family carbohydrate kinase, partial [Candidatus Nitrosocosmicus sp.]|nr:PfkB family carbohydrate kinase [Candidatus Nitrosocosmicus sp.]
IGMAVTWIDLEDLKKGIAHCKYLIGNDYEISSIFEKTGSEANELIGKGTSIITTLGEKGVHYIDSEHEYEIPAYRGSKIIDPTGAGDAFRGGFVAGITSGKTTLDSLKQGNAIASFAIEKYGTVNHKPTRSEIEERAKTLN